MSGSILGQRKSIFCYYNAKMCICECLQKQTLKPAESFGSVSLYRNYWFRCLPMNQPSLPITIQKRVLLWIRQGSYLFFYLIHRVTLASKVQQAPRDQREKRLYNIIWYLEQISPSKCLIWVKLVHIMLITLCRLCKSAKAVNHIVKGSIIGLKKSILSFIMCVVFQGYPGEDSKTPGPPGPLGEPVGLNFL